MNQILVPDKPPAQRTGGKKQCRRVLHLINGEHYSGAERVQDLLALSLLDHGWEVGFACMKPDRFPAQRISQSSRLYRLGMKSRFDFRFLKSLTRVIKRQRYELLHAHTPRTLLVGGLVARRCRVPLVYHVHSPVGRDSTRVWNNRINQWVETWLARRAAHMICVSDSLRSYMIQLGHDADRLTTVPNGVSIVHDVADRQPPRGTWTLGTTALFRPRKGTEVLLQALAKLHRSGLPIRLLAVGPFESEVYQSEILQQAAELGVSELITWTGFASDVNAHLQQMDVFVLPSLFGEGLPMVVLEAMANGTPVVAANVEGVSQAIRHEQDGLLFEPGRPDQLALQIRRIMDGQVSWPEIRQSALNRQREKFSDDSMARGVAAVYQRVLN